MKKLLLVCLIGVLFSCGTADKDMDSAAQENVDRLFVNVLNFEVLTSEDACNSILPK
jgi:hypothetical protein